ncbi:MAG TPA: gluconate 2-dehydrogenase subunit 3 family protein [Candidatus Sulfotelmatobacter sp.]|nr:gluconate 2-dehydrogenase subunit 3 family protein [Candidatus Sulfotelmatobacter sp.]
MESANNGSRRQFLIRSATGLSAAWMLANWPAILSAHEHARQGADSANYKLEFFSGGQAKEVEAVAAQIIPSDDTPGAREARVVYFIDRALTTFDRDQQSTYTNGLEELDKTVADMFPGKAQFSSLSNEEQIKLLTAIEKTEFFERVRVHTIMGFVADPSYGGNFNQIGWKLIGFENQSMHQAPFGYYDAEAAKQNS